MISLDPNFRDLVNCFNSRNVRYLLVGGYAVNYHGHERATKDFDLWIEPIEDNAQRVSLALQDFGFAASSVDPAKFTSEDKAFAFGREPFRVDLLTTLDGLTFADCYERRVEAVLDDLRLPVLSRNDLLRNKRASGRPRDLADVSELCG